MTAHTDCLEPGASIVVLAREPDFIGKLGQLLGGADILLCNELSQVLQRLTADDVELLVVHLSGHSLDPTSLVRALVAASGHAPVLTLCDGPALTAEVIAAGAPCNLPASAPAHSLAAAIERLRATWAEQRDTARTGAQAMSRLSKRHQWGKDIDTWLQELVHEVRTPIAIVAGFASNVLSDIYGPLNSAQRPVVERIQVAADLLTDIVQRAHDDVPRNPDKEQAPEPRAVVRRQLDLAGAVRQVIALYQPRLAEAQVTLHADLDDCPQLWGERSRLSQLLINLIGNACRHTPAGGAITVSARPKAGEGERAYDVELSVQDTGPGIEWDDLNQIFEAGWTKARAEGHAGMGLAICKQIVGEHGGTLKATNAYPGARFTATLPIDPRHRQPKLTVTLVDDVTLAGQLMMELDQRDAAVEIERPTDMEQLADELRAAGGRIMLLNAQSMDAPLRAALSKLTESTWIGGENTHATNPDR